MSAEDAFQFIGAGAGLTSLVWLISTQIFGTYEARTIRRVLDKFATSMETALDRIETLRGG